MPIYATVEKKSRVEETLKEENYYEFVQQVKEVGNGCCSFLSGYLDPVTLFGKRCSKKGCDIGTTGTQAWMLQESMPIEGYLPDFLPQFFSTNFTLYKKYEVPTTKKLDHL